MLAAINTLVQVRSSIRRQCPTKAPYGGEDASSEPSSERCKQIWTGDFPGPTARQSEDGTCHHRRGFRSGYDHSEGLQGQPRCRRTHDPLHAKGFSDPSNLLLHSLFHLACSIGFGLEIGERDDVVSVTARLVEEEFPQAARLEVPLPLRPEVARTRSAPGTVSLH